MSIRKSLQSLCVSFIALSATSSAFAADAQQVKDALSATFANFGMTLNTTAVEANGDNIVLKGLTVTPTSGATGEPSPAVDVTLEAVTEDENAFFVGQVAAPAANYPVKDGAWDFGGAAVKNLRIAKSANTDPLAGALVYESIEIMPTKFVSSTGLGDLITTNGFKATMSPYAAGQPMDFVMSGDFSINAAEASKDNPEAGPVLAELGLNTISAKISAKGGWNPADGKFELTQEDFDIANVGKLGLTFSISGYTAEFARSLQDMMKASAGSTDGENGMKMMGMMQQLTFNSMALRFDDAGFTSKALDLAAKRMGQPRDALVMQAKGMAPMVVMQLQDGDLTAAVSTAVSAYLDNPKSLEIKLAPAAPVPFSVITATGMSTPQALVKQLGLSVTANQ